MPYSVPYTLTPDKSEILVRFGTKAIDTGDLSRFLSYLEMETIRKRSKLSPEDASRLAREIDRSAWKKIQARRKGA